MKTNITESSFHSLGLNKNIVLKNIQKIFKENNILNEKVLLENKTLKVVLKDLLNDIILKDKTPSSVLDILKNLSQFKELNSFANELKLLIKNIKIQDPKNINIIKLEKLLIDIDKVDDNTFKNDILKDTKELLSNIKNLFTNDIDISKQIANLQTMVDYYNLLSIVNNSYNTYLPFNWEELENGNINFIKEQNQFICRIFLSLKYYGDININLLLDDNKYLSIYFFIQKDILKHRLQQNLKQLKRILYLTKIKLRDIHIGSLDTNKTEYENNIYKDDCSFEVMA